MKLSILIPSNRPEGLTNFLNSLAENTNKKDDIEIVVLIDAPTDLIEKGQLINGFSLTLIHKVPEKPLIMGNLNHACYEQATGDWIMLGNDDILCKTKGWDDIVRATMDAHEDELVLIYPNDEMFGDKLACFPIISRKLIDLVDLFPMPYHRYKIDDTIFYLMPPSRRIYLENVIFTHLNSDLNPKTEGYRLPDGKIYPIDIEVASIDNKIWESEHSRRVDMFDKLNTALGIPKRKVLIGIITDEYARRADFYDYYNILTKPIDTVAFFCHARSPAKGRNIIIDAAIAQGCSHILFVDDDMAYQPDLLMKLLDNDLDIVSGLYLSRAYPHEPFAFDVADEDGACQPMYLVGGEPRIVPIVAAGFGFLLVKTSIFTKLEKPYVRLGELNNEEWCDDIGFFKRVREAGIKSYVDTTVCVGHMGTMIVWPNKGADGKWYTGYDTSGRGAINTPQITPEILEAQKPATK